MADNKKPLVSIIITSYTMKRFKGICDLLDSIKIQSYPNLEVIFVAERSKELLKNVESYAKGIGLSLRTVFNGGRWGLSEARNLGIKIANGDIIAFVDDDILLFPSWVQEMVNTYRDDSIIGVTGPALPLWEDKSISWFPEEFHWILSCTSWMPFNELSEIRNVWGHNFSFRKEAFEKCGLFSTEHGFPKGTYEGFLGEDNEFSLRVKVVTGKRIVYNPKVWVRHKVHAYRLSWRFIIRRSFWLGYSRQIMRRQYKSSGNDLLNIERSLLKNIFRSFMPRTLKTLSYSHLML